MERLASEGVLFDQCYSSAPWTVPSHVSMLTSTHPSDHGVGSSHTRLTSSTTTLASWLRSNGYATLGVVSAINVSSRCGFDKGFDEFDDDFVADSEKGLRRGRLVTDRALQLLDTVGDRPFFLFLHYFDAHVPLRPPEPYRSMFLAPDSETAIEPTHHGLANYSGTEVDMSTTELTELLGLYDGAIRFIDDEILRVVEHLKETGSQEKTVIAIVADHGETYEERGFLGHRYYLWNEVIRVPCVVLGPGLDHGSRIAEPFRTIDLAPTLLDLAGIRVPVTFAGTS